MAERYLKIIVFLIFVFLCLPCNVFGASKQGNKMADIGAKIACGTSRIYAYWSSTKIYNDITKKYVDATDKYIGHAASDGGYYASCDVAVATIVRSSGVDPNFEAFLVPNQLRYLNGNSDWKRVGIYYKGTNTASLEPGDVLIVDFAINTSSNVYGHIWMYLGNEAVRKYYPDSNADSIEAGYSSYPNGSYYPTLFNAEENLYGDSRTYAIFRFNGIDYVDATITGMGRGAGNLKMELLLTYLNKHEGLEVDFNVLGDVITAFAPLKEKYGWGTNLPYMLSGANNIPQKEVMEWVTNRVYSFNSIVRALDNRKNNAEDNARFPLFEPTHKFDNVIVVGGGTNALEHQEAIKTFIASKPNTAMVFATARNAQSYLDIDVAKYYCLVGNEGHRLTANVGANNFKGTCILPPYPRTMGTEVPDFAKDTAYELKSINFIDQYKDSVTTIALELAMTLTEQNIYVVGYDGYPGNILSEKEVALTNENKAIFTAYQIFRKSALKSLTPSIYKELDVKSVYQFI